MAIMDGVCETCRNEGEVFTDDSQCITCKRLDAIDEMMKKSIEATNNLARLLEELTKPKPHL